MRWRRTGEGDLLPAPRAGCAVASPGYEDDERVFLFGGMDETARRAFNEMWVLDTAYGDEGAYAFELVTPTQGDLHLPAPEPRWNHSLTAIDDFLFLFGGEGLDYRPIPGLSVYSIGLNAWIKTRRYVPEPPARHQHCAVAVAGNLFVFGGTGSVEDLGDVWELDTEIMAWKEHRTRNSPLYRAAPEGSRPAPVPLQGACCAAVGHCVYVWSGRTEGMMINDKMWVLDTRAMEWHEVPQMGDVPPPTARGAAGQSLLDKTDVAFFGGATEFGKTNDIFVCKLPAPDFDSPTPPVFSSTARNPMHHG